MPNRILLVTPASPFKLQSGGQQRTALLFEALSSLGPVDVLLLEPGTQRAVADSPDPRILAQARWHSMPLGIAKYRSDAELTRQINERASLSNYDLIVGRYLNPICKLDLPQHAQTLVDLDDWGYHYGGNACWTPKSILAHVKSTYAQILARRQLKRFDAFYFVSDQDKASEPCLKSEVLPNIPFAPPRAALPQSDSKNIIFVGALWYGPNREGVEHFLKHCWPGIRANVPDATLTLVGGASPSVRTVWAKLPGVQAPGFVDDLGVAYEDAAIAIAPIDYGGGTNIKILESLAYGRACVTTPRCANALRENLHPGEGLVVAENDAQWIEWCTKLLTDSQERAKIANSGHAIVTVSYTKTRFIDAAVHLANNIINA